MVEMKKLYLDEANVLEIDELAASSGEVRGIPILTDAQYVRRGVGKEMLHNVEFITKELGYPIHYGAIKANEWYPLILRVVSLLAIKQALCLDDEKIKEMGKSALNYSRITKLMHKYFISLEELAEKLQTYWRHNYSTGSLKGMVIDRSAFICLSDFSLHPILSNYLEGYFVGVLKMVIGEDEWISVKKTEKWHSDIDCHDFILRW